MCGILKVTFEISHKISYPYIERGKFYSKVKIEELLDLRAYNCVWNAPPPPPPPDTYTYYITQGFWEGGINVKLESNVRSVITNANDEVQAITFVGLSDF